MIKPVLTSVLSPVILGITQLRRKPGGGGALLFPAKTFYFTDFTGIADSTTLRSLPGWAAYSLIGSTNSARDEWRVQSEAVTRTTTQQDYDPMPGKFIVGRDVGSTDHIYRCSIKTLPLDGLGIAVAVAATTNTNAIFLQVTRSGANMQEFSLSRNVGNTVTVLSGHPGSTSGLGRSLLPGDEIELHILGQFVHLFVNGRRVTPVAGTSLDTGAAFVKGTICGHGSAQGSGCVFDDEYIAALTASLTFTDTPIFWPGSVALGGRIVPIAGTYTGDVQALDYRVLNDSTDAVVTDWARVSGATIGAGAWSGNVFVPMSDNTVNPKVRIQVRVANDIDARVLSNATAVGLAVGSYGQSNSAFRGQGGATSHAVTNAYSWSLDASSQWLGGTTTTTERTQLLATQISARSGIPCGTFVFGVGSQTLENLTARGAGFFDDLEATAAQSNSAGYIQAWLWTQGEAEADANAPFNATSYRSTFDTLLSQLRASLSESLIAPVGVCIIGPYTGTHLNGAAFGDANWSSARSGLFGLRDKTGVHVACNLSDAAMADAFHYTANAYVENGRRAGLSMAAALGYGGYSGRGPIITGATRSGAVITLPVDLNGAASIAGTGLTNYEVTTDGFATTKTISSAAVSGSNIVLTLSADPGAAVQVRSFYGMTYGTPTRAIGTYADATTIPVEPLFVAITSN
jgi:hypothetical protein